jgi:hypothetical protein
MFIFVVNMKTNNCENNILCFISFGFNINHCFPSDIQLTLFNVVPEPSQESEQSCGQHAYVG